MRALVVLLVGTVAAIGLWVSQCSGPRPELSGQPMISAPTAPGEPFHIDVGIKNAGPGHGQVEVIVRLHDRTAGRTYQQDAQVDLEPREEVHVVVEIFAPPGTYEPDVDLRYPPD